MLESHGAARQVSLAEIKARTLKPLDAWWTVLIIDPIAIRLLWIVVRLGPQRVHPNQVTTASLVVGLSAAVLFARGSYVAGALVYQLAFVLDCVDGKLSRLRDLASRRGAFWDGLVNNIVFSVNVVGLSWNDMHRAPATAIAAMVVLTAWALHMYIEGYVTTRGDAGHPVFAIDRGGWLFRHRLGPPLTWPDKHAILLFVGPVFNTVTATFLLIAVVDSLTMVLKARSAWRAVGADGGREHRRARIKGVGEPGSTANGIRGHE